MIILVGLSIIGNKDNPINLNPFYFLDYVIDYSSPSRHAFATDGFLGNVCRYSSISGKFHLFDNILRIKPT